MRWPRSAPIDRCAISTGWLCGVEETAGGRPFAPRARSTGQGLGRPLSPGISVGMPDGRQASRAIEERSWELRAPPFDSDDMGKTAARSKTNETTVLVEVEEVRVSRLCPSRYGCAVEVRYNGRRYLVLTDRRGLVHAQEILRAGRSASPSRTTSLTPCTRRSHGTAKARGTRLCVTSTA
jgi:hypothetical protein